MVGLEAGSDNFAWEYLAGTQLKSKLTRIFRCPSL